MHIRADLTGLARAGALVVACALPAAGQDRAAGVSTDFVERREVSETVPVFAEVVAIRESDVAVRVSGVVLEVPVVVGSEVAEGDVLAILDRELLEIELLSAEADLSEAVAGIGVAQADLRLAEQGFARADGLRGTNAFSQGAFDERDSALARARGEVAQAEARHLRAEAALTRAVYDLARAELRAPFAGTVLEIQVDPGEYVQTGATAVRLLDSADLEVEANVPAQFVAALAGGLQLDGETSDGAALDLTVRAILPLEFSGTRTRPVRLQARFETGGLPVAVGQSVRVSVPTAQPQDVLLVPKDAVTQARGAWSVFVHEDGKAVPRSVEIGRSFGPDFEVISGLAPGDEVVVRGNERLRPMQDIAPTPITGATPPGTATAPETAPRRDGRAGAHGTAPGSQVAAAD